MSRAWTARVRNYVATAASQRLGGKVSAYIRKLEVVLKAAKKGAVVGEGAINQVPRTGGGWRYSQRKAGLRAPVTSTESNYPNLCQRGGRG